MGKEITIWYDKEGDFLEVMFDTRAGYFTETEHDKIMKKIDHDGNVIGFHILGVHQLKDKRLLSIDTTRKILEKSV
ncbi:DUF2283 domain-containing protein [bacterium]|nr:DUF2283 domain-containing protein [bacterium]